MGSGLFQAQCQRHKTGLTHTIAHTGLVYMATSPFPPIVDGPNGSSSQYDLDRLGKHTLPPLLVGPQSHDTDSSKGGHRAQSLLYFMAQRVNVFPSPLKS